MPQCADPAHQFPCPRRHLKVRVAADISLYGINDNEAWPEGCDCLLQPFIVQRQTVIDFFIYKSDIAAVSTTAFKPGFDGIPSAVLRALIDNPLESAYVFPVRSFPTFGEFRNQMEHHGGFPVSWIALQECDLSNGDIWVPQPLNWSRLYIAV